MLDDLLRGILEKIIDNTIKTEHRSTFTIFMAKMSGLDIKSELDYGLGHAHGAIRASFIRAFFDIKRRPPDDYETGPKVKITYDGTKEVERHSKE